VIRQPEDTGTPDKPPAMPPPADKCRQLLADEVYITLQDAPAPPPGAGPAAPPATPAAPFFSGDFASMKCTGNVEVKTSDQFVQCDSLFYDKVADQSLLEVSDPENDVRVYMQEESGGSRVLCARKSLALDGKSGAFTPGGMLLIRPYSADKPAPLGKDSSPMRGRKQAADGK